MASFALLQAAIPKGKKGGLGFVVGGTPTVLRLARIMTRPGTGGLSGRRGQ